MICFNALTGGVLKPIFTVCNSNVEYMSAVKCLLLGP